MDIEETSGPYRGFLRSGSYPALTQRIVNSGGVLLRAASWFALVVTAASAGYNMTQRLVSQSVALRPQADQADQANQAELAASEPAFASAAQALPPSATGPQARVPLEDPAHELAVARVPADPHPARASASASSRTATAAVDDKDSERNSTPKRKSIETGAVASSSHTHQSQATGVEPDVEASASEASEARASIIAERVRALDLAASAAPAAATNLTVTEALPTQALVSQPMADSQPASAAVSGDANPLPLPRAPQRFGALTSSSKPAAPAPQPLQAERAKPAPQLAQQLPLAATARIDNLAVNGSVSSANVRHGLERVQPTLSECYARAARQAGENRFSQVRVQVKIDEAGRVKTLPTVEGAQLPGLEACLSSAFSKLVCRAPDTGTAKASITLSFGPLALASASASVAASRAERR